MDNNGKALTCLEDEREYYIAARGGAGGKGNHHFATSTDTVPQYSEDGGMGEERTLYLEMRMMAHAGLVREFKLFGTQCQMLGKFISVSRMILK